MALRKKRAWMALMLMDPSHLFMPLYSEEHDSGDNEDESMFVVERIANKARQRMDWEFHRKSLLRERKFKKMYRMHADSFDRLVVLLDPFLQRDEKMSRVSSGQDFISNYIVVHCLLRYLAGGNVHDIRCTAGVSHSYFYELIKLGMKAVNACDALKMVLPDLRPNPNLAPDEVVYKTLSDARRLSQLSATFSKNATCVPNLITGCVRAIDGWLATIRVPTKAEEAMCDGDSRFIGVSMRSPGGANDATAYKKASFLDTFISHLPRSLHIVGDNAYPLSRQVLVPFRATDMRTADAPQKDVYNFFQSQMRIRIEMAFGMLVSK